ncbi:uroporphyrinogen decarboxylase family protein [Oscillospiraceae bacterium WX1]
MINIGASSYEEKLQRMDNAAKLKKVDRVPIGVNLLYFPAKYSGLTYEEMFYDQEKFIAASTKFARDFNWDAAGIIRSFETVTLGLALAGTDAPTAINVALASIAGGGFAHDILKDHYSSHPGREISVNNESQFKIKDTLMSAEEYDDLLADPFGFINEKIVPRAYGALSKPGSGEATTALINFGMKLGPALEGAVKYTQEMKAANTPPYYFSACPNPLDALGAFLRDFDKVIMDVHRVPAKVKKVCEALAPVLLAVGKMTGDLSYQLTGSRRVFCPVWYNSFLSKREFKEFHWPYLKWIVEELIKDDYTPLLSLQGNHDHLLDTLLELPEGKAIAWMDRTNLTKAKEVIGNHMCIGGGCSPALLIGGTPEEVDARVKEILDEMKSCRGFIWTLPFNAIGPAKVENIVAMTEAVHKYGAY